LQSSRAGWRRCSRSPRYEANLIARLMSLIRRPNSNRSMIFGAMNQLVGRDRG
jgi:hypothetical protein